MDDITQTGRVLGLQLYTTAYSRELEIGPWLSPRDTAVIFPAFRPTAWPAMYGIIDLIVG